MTRDWKPEHGGFGGPPSQATAIVTACIVLCVFIGLVALSWDEIKDLWRWVFHG